VSYSSCTIVRVHHGEIPPLLEPSANRRGGNSPRWTTWGRGRPPRRAKLLQRPLLRTEDKKDSDSVDVLGGSFPARVVAGVGSVFHFFTDVLVQTAPDHVVTGSVGV